MSRYYVTFHEESVTLSNEHGTLVPDCDGVPFLVKMGDTDVLVTVKVSGGGYAAAFDMDVYIPDGCQLRKHEVRESLFNWKFREDKRVHFPR